MNRRTSEQRDRGTNLLRGTCAWLTATVVGTTACVPQPGAQASVPPGDTSTPSGASTQTAAAAFGTPEKPAAPPAAPTPANANTRNRFTDRFLELWQDVHRLENGYFSKEGIPYHAVETLLVEAPDHGHETTSEAYSYWIWLEAMYGKVTGDWSHLDRAWKNMEYYIIPTHEDQPTTQGYQAGKPATYSEEGDLPSDYPKPLIGSVQVGRDPIAPELREAYGTSDVYGMHWLLDVDNFYGYGKRGDGTSRASYINTFQRGPQESVWETVTQPAWDDFQFGGTNGFLDIYQSGNDFAKQWKYTTAPDADARAVQAVYWAKTWADEGGGSPVVDALAGKAAMMGDYCRYALFDKYFKRIGCDEPGCPVGGDRQSAHYLISWYYAWGGAVPGSGNWSWRIGSSHAHSGYQNPMAAHALGTVEAFKPKSPTAARDWQASLTRQLEFYRWLQSAEGGIAGGATNSWKGRYEKPPSGIPTFYGMAYESSPVFLDPPSNDWFGFQVWSVQRVAELYYATGNERAEVILDRFVGWLKKHIKLGPKGRYAVPAVLSWSGQPASDWNAEAQNFDGKDKSYNSTLHVKVTATSDDVGVSAGVAHTLSFYAKRKGDADAQKLAAEILDRMWKKYRDDKGVANLETRKDYKRFADKLYLPSGWSGKMPNGDNIVEGATFLDIRSDLKKDPSFAKVEKYLSGGGPPEFTYHRFWAQAHIALALATHGWLFPEDGK